MYSTSFSVGIYFLDATLRNPVYSIYGFVRIADEIVDSFHDYDKKYLLDKLEQETWDAIENRISVNPVLNSFQHVVHKYNISHDLIHAFLKSMRMDLEKTNYTPENYRQSLFGSSESVGLMCLHVFTGDDPAMYENLKPYAMKLGAAFQKVNFLRDLKSDHHSLGRIYFPGVDITQFTEESKQQIEQEIEKDFTIALAGIKKLPRSSRRGVFLAYMNYRSLFNKIKRTPAAQMLRKRVRINNGKKLSLMIGTLFQTKLSGYSH